VFRGINAINLDAKGRMGIPSKHRERLDGRDVGADNAQLIVTLAPRGNCLLLYTLDEWERLEQRLVKLPELDDTSYRIKHTLLGHATECDLDANSRILLPVLLRELVRIQKRIILVGMGNKFEVWDEQAWSDQRARTLEAASRGELTLPPELTGLTL
jgi:MraZ protein